MRLYARVDVRFLDQYLICGIRDEEFARQIEATISPVQSQQSTFANISEANMNLDTEHYSDEGPESIMDTESRIGDETSPDPFSEDATSPSANSYLVESQASQHNDVSQNLFPQPTVQNVNDDRPLMVVCPECYQSRSGPRYPVCFACGNQEVPILQLQEVVPPTVTNPVTYVNQNFSTSTQLPDLAAILRTHLHQQQQRTAQRQALQQVSAAALAHGRPGTSSNPFNLDSLPRFSTPTGLLNNGWQPAFGNPSPVSLNLPNGIYRQPYPYNTAIPNLTNDELKDLLQNIRPDEEIEVEDPDSHIPGLSRRLHLMKHQRV